MVQSLQNEPYHVERAAQHLGGRFASVSHGLWGQLAERLVWAGFVRVPPLSRQHTAI